MENKEHKCTIGIYFDYDDTCLVSTKSVTIEEVVYLSGKSNMSEVIDEDERFKKFSYCPFCGKKLDWEELKKEIGGGK